MEFLSSTFGHFYPFFICFTVENISLKSMRVFFQNDLWKRYQPCGITIPVNREAKKITMSNAPTKRSAFLTVISTFYISHPG